MRTRLKRLFLVVMAIVMTTHCFGEGAGDKIEVLKNTYNLVFEVLNPNNHTVKAMAGAATEGDIVVPATVQDKQTQGTVTWKVVIATRFGTTKITSVKLEEGIETLADGCFGGATALTSVEIPATVKKIDGGVFANCPKLNSVKIADDNVSYVMDDGILYNMDKTEILYYPQNKTEDTYTLLESVKTVSKGAFSGNKNLTKIILPANLESFDPSAIDGCEKQYDFEVSTDASNFSVKEGLLCDKAGTRLIAVPYARANTYGLTSPFKIPDGVQTIGSYAFCQCRNLRSVELNQTVKMEDNAFFRCNLQEVSIPATTTDISSTALVTCGLLEKINVDDNNKVYASIDGVLFNHDKTTLMTYPKKHKGDEEGTYTIPDGVIVIDNGAFEAASEVNKVKFASTVKTIGETAFLNSSLTELELNEGLETIGLKAFFDTKLTSVHIPASVKTIGNSAFYTNLNERPLKSVTIAANSQLATLDYGAFSGNHSLESFTFEGSCEQLTVIDENAFKDCKNLKLFAVPASVTTIKQNAFNGCKSLAEINFADNAQLTYIGSNAFQDCQSLVEVKLPASLNKIDKEAFNRCSGLKQIDIPAATNNIHYSAFQFCNNLTEIKVAATSDTYSSVDGMLASKDQKTLVIFPAGKANDKITLLSPAFEKIGDYAFYNCQKLTNVTIPKKVDAIGTRAFGLCDNLNTIAFLGDEPIDLAAKTNQANDTYAFLGTGNADILANCTICVRKGKEDKYLNHTKFWATYANNIITSFKEENSKFQNDKGENEYEEYFPMSANAVSLLTTTSTAHTLVIPASVKTTINGTEKTYNVNMIGDYAFENTNKNIKEVVLEGNIIYIGSWAFNKIEHSGDQSAAKPSATVEANDQIKNIFFLDRVQSSTELSTKRFGLDDEKVYHHYYDEFVDGQNIYVRKSVYNEVNKDVNNSTWGQYAKKLAYKIPLSFSTTYSTLSREFDVDMSEKNWSDEKNSPKVIAFTSGYYHKTIDADTKADKFYVHMESINCGASEGDGTYIPANTGVLLKNVEGKGNLPSDFYYQIYDKDTDIPAAPTNNLMQAVVERDGELISYKMTNHKDYQFYDFGLGTDDMLHRYMGQGSEGKGRKVDVHQSYLRLSRDAYDLVNPANPSAVKLCMVFDIDNNTTGIEDVKTDGEKEIDNEAYYTLQGVKVAHPTKGIYVHGGKKVVIK